MYVCGLCGSLLKASGGIGPPPEQTPGSRVRKTLRVKRNNKYENAYYTNNIL